MPSQCAYALCKIKKTKQNISQGITFHKFPTKNLLLRKQWIRAMRRVSWKPKPWDVVDSTHFKPSDFDRTGQTVRLRSGAIPSLFGQPEKKIKERKTKTSAKAKETHDGTNHDNSKLDCNVYKNQKTKETHCDINEDNRDLEDVNQISSKLLCQDQERKSLVLSAKEQIANIRKFHNYAATCPEDFKNRLRQALDRNEVLEKRLKNTTKREQYYREKMESLVCDLKNQNLLTDELAACLQTYEDMYFAKDNWTQ